MKINISKLIFSIIIAFLPGWIGSYFTYSKIPTWYAQLNKPDFNPPNFVFGPVWTVLYILMGLSLYIIWNKKVLKKFTEIRKKILQIFLVQLVLNGLWSIVFFGTEQILASLIIIILLWISILVLIFYSIKISKTAAYILIPYLLWITFATVLNFSIFILN